MPRGLEPEKENGQMNCVCVWPLAEIVIDASSCLLPETPLETF